MTRYISLAEYFWLAEQVTGIEAAVVTKAAVLVCRLAWNYPLPDGNKRAAWAALVMFLDLNGVRWEPDPPNVDEAEVAMLAVAEDGIIGCQRTRAVIRESAWTVRRGRPKRPENDLVVGTWWARTCW